MAITGKTIQYFSWYKLFSAILVCFLVLWQDLWKIKWIHHCSRWKPQPRQVPLLPWMSMCLLRPPLWVQKRPLSSKLCRSPPRLPEDALKSWSVTPSILESLFLLGFLLQFSWSPSCLNLCWTKYDNHDFNIYFLFISNLIYLLLIIV